MTAAFFSEALADHDRSAFASGNERIDNYFRQTVSQDVKRSYAACYVLIDKASARLAGFYTLSSHSIALTELAADVARKLPRYPSVPAVLIGCGVRSCLLPASHRNSEWIRSFDFTPS